MEEPTGKILYMLDHYKRMYDLYFDKLMQRLDEKGIVKEKGPVKITQDDIERAKPTEMNIFKP